MAKKRKIDDVSMQENGHSTHMAGKRIYNKKVVKQKGAKKVKVAPRLRKAIKQVIDSVKVHGSITNHYLGGYIAAQDRKQTVQSGDGSIINSAGTWMFDLTSIADAAAQLFHKKAALNTSAGMNPFSTGNFDPATLQLNVRNSYSILRYKNITPHCIVLKLFVCVPKKKSANIVNDNPTSAYGKFNVSKTVEDSLATPYQYWQKSLAIDITNGYVLPGNFGGSATGANSIQDFYREPTQSKSFNNGYKVEKIQFHIEPGQTIVQRIQGPKNMFVDYGKNWEQDVFMNIQKFSRGVIPVLYNTLNAKVNAVPAASFGRFADVTDTPAKGYALAVERTDHYSITMPEQVGFTLTSATTPTVYDLELRRPRTKVNIFDVDSPANTIGCLDLSKENPVQNVSG